MMLLILWPSVISAKINKISPKDLFLTNGACIQFDGVLVEANQYVQLARDLQRCEVLENRSLELRVERTHLQRELDDLKLSKDTGMSKGTSFAVGLLIGLGASLLLTSQ